MKKIVPLHKYAAKVLFVFGCRGVYVHMVDVREDRVVIHLHVHRLLYTKCEVYPDGIVHWYIGDSLDFESTAKYSGSTVSAIKRKLL